MNFSPKIDKILLALQDSSRQPMLTARLYQLAPCAAIRCANTLPDTLDNIEHWRPVIALIDLAMGEGEWLSLLERGALHYRPPFMLAFADDVDCEQVARAMRCGVGDVLNTAVDEQRFAAVLKRLVSEPVSLEQCISSMVNPLLYAEDGQLDLKKLSDQFEHHIFTRASHVATSKNNLARLLGISRQLVQYHLKKKQSAS